MNIFIYITTIIITGIILYNIYEYLFTTQKIIEGLENNNLDNDSKVLIYKNAGTVKNLEQTVNNLSNQINTIITDNDKQNSDIENLKGLISKNEKVSTEANKLANKNKERLLKFSKQAKEKSDSVQNELKDLPSVDGVPSP